LTFDHFGADHGGSPANPYVVNIVIAGVFSEIISRIYPIPGPGATGSTPFTATASSHTLTFIDATPGDNQPSAIFDNIQISTVPEPSTLGLIGLGLLGLDAMRRRRRYR
jgi:hypothetical protein